MALEFKKKNFNEFNINRKIMKYLLLIPVNNEENNIQNIEKSVINQTTKPSVCIIIDSGSNDNTYFNLKKTFKDKKWVYIIKQTKFLEFGYSHINFAQAINEGYLYAKRICKENQITYDFIGKTDATPELSENYFELLGKELQKDPKLAFVCGSQLLEYNKKVYSINKISKISDTGLNDIRLYRADFFELMGGYPLVPSPDSVLLVKAKNRNFSFKIVQSAIFIKHRIGGSKIGIWKGYKLIGQNRFFLGYHPFLFIISSLDISYRIPPHYQFVPLTFGFLSGYLGKKRIDDMEILDYYGRKRLSEVISDLLSKNKI